MNQAPIFCDHCAALAFATLDDAPLCAKCLQSTLAKGDPRMVQRIEPLALSESHELIPGIRCVGTDAIET